VLVKYASLAPRISPVLNKNRMMDGVQQVESLVHSEPTVVAKVCEVLMTLDVNLINQLAN
jgi:hypothetical protein